LCFFYHELSLIISYHYHLSPRAGRSLMTSERLFTALPISFLGKYLLYGFPRAFSLLPKSIFLFIILFIFLDLIYPFDIYTHTGVFFTNFIFYFLVIRSYQKFPFTVSSSIPFFFFSEHLQILYMY